MHTADEGTKQGGDIVCPPALWEIFKKHGRHQQMPRTIPYNQLIENAGGLRRWENADVQCRGRRCITRAPFLHPLA